MSVNTHKLVITVDERRRVRLPAKQGESFKLDVREDGAIILTPVTWIPKSQIASKEQSL